MYFINKEDKKLNFTKRKSHADTKKWMHQIEERSKDANIEANRMVHYATQFLKEEATIWWKMQHAINDHQGMISCEEFKEFLLQSRLVTRIPKTQEVEVPKQSACTIYGEVGHTSKEHRDQCPYFEGSHPSEECPTSEVTCFLCKGTNHNPSKCHLYPIVKQVNQQVRDGLCHVMLSLPRKRKDLSKVISFKCHNPGHYAVGCQEQDNVAGKDENNDGNGNRCSNKKPKKDPSQVTCYKCGETGHYKSNCP
uniref:Uncharacterized protein n=1 Tax=Avena sativa TaxID=4498 RepID=A0ACD5TJX0_AVESA